MLKNQKQDIMMENCKIVGKICVHASKSHYDPIYEEYKETENTFCGMISGYDCRVNDLTKCWLDMSNSEKSTHKKKMKIKYES